jgi:hypothetical protein
MKQQSKESLRVLKRSSALWEQRNARTFWRLVFFPLWDRAIAEAYGLALRQRGRNAERYCCFMRITKEQCKELGGEQTIGRNPLKAIDEYNYCKYTKGWI